MEVALFAEEVGLGFSRFVSLGNQADLHAAELVRELAEHEATALIAIYAEDFREGRAFAAAGEAAVRAGKPVGVEDRLHLLPSTRGACVFGLLVGGNSGDPVVQATLILLPPRVRLAGYSLTGRPEDK